MTWDEFKNSFALDYNVGYSRQLTDIECPKCKKKIWKRTDIVLTSYPAQYAYECECGWYGTAYK